MSHLLNQIGLQTGIILIVTDSFAVLYDIIEDSLNSFTINNEALIYKRLS